MAIACGTKTFSAAQLRAIQNTTLADIIRANTNTFNLQDNVFQFHASISGTVSNLVSVLTRFGSFNILKGVAGITVNLINVADNEVVATATTDARGNYSFDIKEAAQYQVQVVLSAANTSVNVAADEIGERDAWRSVLRQHRFHHPVVGHADADSSAAHAPSRASRLDAVRGGDLGGRRECVGQRTINLTVTTGGCGQEPHCRWRIPPAVRRCSPIDLRYGGIFVHRLRHDTTSFAWPSIGCTPGILAAYGNTWINTPAIDRLAAESFVLDRAVIDSPQLEIIYRSLWQGLHAMVPAAASGAAQIAATSN